MIHSAVKVFTIGHSNHSFAAFAALLRMHGVTVVADVRSSPYSRFVVQFNRKVLERELKAVDVGYVFLGRELGARPEDPDCYENGRVRYARLAETERFQRGIQRLLDGASRHTIAILCAEKEPLECHRTLLVARALVRRGAEVEHILADGRLEAHPDAMTRLLDLVGVPRADLFRSREELIEDALARQESRIAFVDRSAAAGPGFVP
jgi:uncharacterized protein (DUF488 family)